MMMKEMMNSMEKKGLFFALLVAALLFSSPTVWAGPQHRCLEGKWKVEGQSARWGKYKGTLSLSHSKGSYRISKEIHTSQGLKRLSYPAQIKKSHLTYSYSTVKSHGIIGALRNRGKTKKFTVQGDFTLSKDGQSAKGTISSKQNPQVKASEKWTFLHPFQKNYSAGQAAAIASRFAPVIFQEVDRGTFPDDPRGKEDFITGVDFDGDNRCNNNWENTYKFPLKGVVYFSLVETETHYFISYSIYHPRDWSRYKWFYVSHENDMENLQVVVRKGKTKAQDQVQVLLTQEHISSDIANRMGSKVKAKRGSFHGNIAFFNDKGYLDSKGKHPGVFVERKGHGIYSMGNDDKVRPKYDVQGRLVSLKKRRYVPLINIWEKFPVVVYVPGSVGKEPSIQLKQRMKQTFEYRVPYGLESVYHRFWTKLEKKKLMGDGKIFGGDFSYMDSRFELPKVPRNFDGNKWAGPFKRDSGISPFALGRKLTDSNLGAYFFNPSEVYSKDFDFPSEWCKGYVYNPYLHSSLNKKKP